MVVLLKTTSVLVSFIQIMQIRVQDKRKTVRKSRYVGDVSGNATPSNKASDFNPSYVLCHASDGYVYAKFVGSSYEYIKWTIWVPKTLCC